MTSACRRRRLCATIIALPLADHLESERLIEPDRRRVAGVDLEKAAGDPVAIEAAERLFHQQPAETVAAARVSDRDGQHLGLVGRHPADDETRQPPPAEERLAPRGEREHRPVGDQHREVVRRPRPLEGLGVDLGERLGLVRRGLVDEAARARQEADHCRITAPWVCGLASAGRR